MNKNMANFAILNSNNKVINIITVDDNDIINNGGDFSKQSEDYIKNKFNIENLKQYSINGSVRFNPARINGYYDQNNNAFINEQPYLSWILDNQFKWVSPTPYPNSLLENTETENYYSYRWNEEKLTWVAEHNKVITHIWNNINLSWESV